MRDGWKMTHCLPKNKWNCKPKPSSLHDTSQWLLSLLLVASQFSFFFSDSNIVISNRYVHFYHRFFIAHVLFNVGVFVICMLPLPYSPNYSFFFILQSFCDIIVMLPSIQHPSLISPSSLSSCNGKQFGALRQAIDLLARTRKHGGDTLTIPTSKLCCHIIENIQAVTNLSMITHIANGLM